MAGQSLKDKTVKGVGWSAADAFLGQGITFLVGIILARMLTPVEYGLIGIVLIFTTVLNGIVDSGFSSAIIRKENATNADYNTMFCTNMVVSLILYIFLYLSAFSIASFFGRMELVNLIRVLGIVLILQALSITQVTILTKRIDFKTKTKASVIAAIISGCIGIWMAYNGFGVWSLVGQILSNKLLYTACLWFFNRWWPDGSFSTQSFHYMWGFGWKLMVSGLLNNIWEQLYQVVVGKFYSPTNLGQYTRSREYANLFSSNFTSIVQRVTYPALSQVQKDEIRMLSAYRKVIKLSMFITAICMISLGAVAEPFVYCLIGPQWHEASTYLPLICISLSLYPLHAINLNMLKIQGRSDIFLVLEIVKKIINLLPILLGIFVSIYCMLLGSILIGLVSFYLNSFYTGRKLNYSPWQQLRDIAPSYALAFVIALSVFFLKYLPMSQFIILPLQVVVGVIVLLSICERLQIREYVELKGIALSNLCKLNIKMKEK